MANSFYTRVKTFLAGTRARGADVKSEYDLVVDAFDFVEAIVQTDGTLSQNLNGDSETYKLTGMADGVADQDYVTMAQYNLLDARITALES